VSGVRVGILGPLEVRAGDAAVAAALLDAEPAAAGR
jgi:hypothetical protein